MKIAISIAILALVQPNLKAKSETLAEAYPQYLEATFSKDQQSSFEKKLDTWCNNYHFHAASEKEVKDFLHTNIPSEYDLSFYRLIPSKRPGAGILITYQRLKGEISVVFQWNTSGDEKDRTSQTEISGILYLDFLGACPELKQRHSVKAEQDAAANP